MKKNNIFLVSFFSDKVWLYSWRKSCLEPDIRIELTVNHIELVEVYQNSGNSSSRSQDILRSERKGLRVVIRNMSRKSRQICTKTWHLVLFVFLPCSRNFLSTIFGIFGKFRIDIVKNKFETIFFQNEKNLCKKPKNIFSRLKKCRKKFYEKVNENRKFQNFDFPQNFSKFWNFRFSLTFSKKKIEHFVISKNIFRFLFAKNFRRKNLDEKNLFTYSDSKFPKDSKNRT